VYKRQVLYRRCADAVDRIGNEPITINLFCGPDRYRGSSYCRHSEFVL